MFQGTFKTAIPFFLAVFRDLRKVNGKVHLIIVKKQYMSEKEQSGHSRN